MCDTTKRMVEEVEVVKRKILGVTVLKYKAMHIPTRDVFEREISTILSGREATYYLWSQLMKWNSASPGVWQFYI